MPSDSSVDQAVLERLREALAGRYAVERELGRGGMATVFLARELKHSRDVAIKVLDPELATSLGAERFLREIQTTAQLVHPHIVAMHDSGEADGLLYYVMPHVRGESLRARLDRERQLSLHDAVRLAREVASALDHAHARGIVHRDIKPDNILLIDGKHAAVADFGLARAVFSAANRRLTATGLVVGSPVYMSPEQASGERNVDGRTDVYSLGCVLFEMLAGEPPFHGKSVQAVLTRHLTERPPLLRSRGVAVPAAVEEAIARAMAKAPAHRFATAGEFVAALEHGTPLQTRARWLWLELWLRGWKAAVLLTVSIAAVLFGLVMQQRDAHPVRRLWTALTAPPTDSMRYAVVPAVAGVALPANIELDNVLNQALQHWKGIGVVDQERVRAAVAKRGLKRVTPDDARDIATSLGAKRFILVDATKALDSLAVQSALYESGGRFSADTDAVISRSAVRVPVSGAGAAALVAPLAARLLFGEDADAQAALATASFAAGRAFAQGEMAVRRWDLDQAVVAFQAAVASDAQYALAHLRLAQARNWRGDRVDEWKLNAERAASSAQLLPESDKLVGSAQLKLARADAAGACHDYGAIVARDARSFAGWYGLGECNLLDGGVVRDSRTPSRYAFRSSTWRALESYRRAVEILPLPAGVFPAGAYARIRRMLTRPSRIGTDASGQYYIAYASWRADTLEYIPYPADAVRTVKSWTSAVSPRAGQGKVLSEIATGWARALQGNAEAIGALGMSLDMLGLATAADSLQRARTLARTPALRQKLALEEAWIRIKNAAPQDERGLIAARVLCDSILLHVTTDDVPADEYAALLASIAAVRGRIFLTARFAAQGARPSNSDDEIQLPLPLNRTSEALLAYSSFGAPADSITRLHENLDDAIQSAITREMWDRARFQTFDRAAGIAFATRPFPSATWSARSGDYLLDAYNAFVQRDYKTVRALLRAAAVHRQNKHPADFTTDGLYPEAWLLTAIGAHAEAAALLDPTLTKMRWMVPELLEEYPRAATLVRAMALRAELAARTGDAASARRWAKAVLILWDGADAPLQPTLQRMDALAN